jgi:hypothetical protein
MPEARAATQRAAVAIVRDVAHSTAPPNKALQLTSGNGLEPNFSKIVVM